MRHATRWAAALSMIGGLALFVGSIDPLEGSAIILPGSGLLALGSFFAHDDRRTIAYRAWSFVLVAVGVAALWGLSFVGGVGGTSGHAVWWALLIVPYLVGWSLDLWGPGAPRWLSMAGIAIGAWYVALFGIMLSRSATVAQPQSIIPAAIFGAIGAATIIACAVRLSKTSHAIPQH